jgi:hypothetical protein
MQQVEARPRGADEYLRGTWRLIDEEGGERVRETRSYWQDQRGRKQGVHSKRLVVFDAPENIRGTAFLVVSQLRPEAEDLRWIYLPGLRKVRRVSGSDRGQSFAGTDFFYEDLAERGVDEDEHRLLRRALDGRPHHVIESRRAVGVRAARAWIDAERFTFSKLGSTTSPTGSRSDSRWAGARSTGCGSGTSWRWSTCCRHRTVVETLEVGHDQRLGDEVWSEARGPRRAGAACRTPRRSRPPRSPRPRSRPARGRGDARERHRLAAAQPRQIEKSQNRAELGWTSSCDGLSAHVHGRLLYDPVAKLVGPDPDFGQRPRPLAGGRLEQARGRAARAAPRLERAARARRAWTCAWASGRWCGDSRSGCASWTWSTPRTSASSSWTSSSCPRRSRAHAPICSWAGSRSGALLPTSSPTPARPESGSRSTPAAWAGAGAGRRPGAPPLVQLSGDDAPATGGSRARPSACAPPEVVRGVDLALHYFDRIDPRGVFRRRVRPVALGAGPPLPLNQVEREFERVRSLGFSVSTSRGPFTLWGEGMLSHGRPYVVNDLSDGDGGVRRPIWSTRWGWTGAAGRRCS